MENIEKTFTDIQKLASENIDPELKLKIMRELAKPYSALLTYYECAIKEVVTKLEILNKEYSITNKEQNPIDSIKSRVKSKTLLG